MDDGCGARSCNTCRNRNTGWDDMPCVECEHSSWHDSKDHWEPIPDAGDRRKKLLQVQTDLASKIILYGETEEKLSQLRVVDKALNRN